MIIDASNLVYRRLNEKLRSAVDSGERQIKLININGHRYIGDGLKGPIEIAVEGVPGNGLGAFMDGPKIVIDANCQDHVANTMNDGMIVVRGDAGDVLGYGMRGGKLYIRGDAGYRVGIHMKAYRQKVPVIVVGGTVRDFLGEYMAGGIIIVLGLGSDENNPVTGGYLGTGMHGGAIFVRGQVSETSLGREARLSDISESDHGMLVKRLREFASEMSMDAEELLGQKFSKFEPASSRPYSNMYAY